MSKDIAPTDKYRKNWTFIAKFESGKTMNLLSKNPVKKVIGNTKNKEAICGLKTTKDKSTCCLAKIKWKNIKYNTVSNVKLLPPQTAYRYVLRGIKFLKIK